MAKQKIQTHKHRDCAHARDFHSMSLSGNYILCRCDYFPYSMILNDTVNCKDFKPITTNI